MVNISMSITILDLDAELVKDGRGGRTSVLCSHCQRRISADDTCRSSGTMIQEANLFQYADSFPIIMPGFAVGNAHEWSFMNASSSACIFAVAIRTSVSSSEVSASNSTSPIVWPKSVESSTISNLSFALNRSLTVLNRAISVRPRAA